MFSMFSQSEWYTDSHPIVYDYRVIRAHVGLLRFYLFLCLFHFDTLCVSRAEAVLIDRAGKFSRCDYKCARTRVDNGTQRQGVDNYVGPSERGEVEISVGPAQMLLGNGHL